MIVLKRRYEGELDKAKQLNLLLVQKTVTATAPTNASGDTTVAFIDVMRNAIAKEENPYKLWKAMQDIKGNAFFFTVFENQRPETGINYKEVNRMLTSKKQYEREYSTYRQLLDDQICTLIMKSSN